MDKEVVQGYALNEDEKDRETRRAEGGVNVAREGGAGG